MNIGELMQTSGTGFGTSGVRGLVTALTDRVCYAYTLGFIGYLESIGELACGSGTIAVAGDLRSSTDRIMRAVGRAIIDKGYSVINLGRVPSPAAAYYGIQRSIPTVMVTGSHIPDDRNGIKYNKASGEILKDDEAGIKQQTVSWDECLFTADGAFVDGSETELPRVDTSAERMFIARYLDFFPRFLDGKKIALYAHSAVGRSMLYEVLMGLGADVTVIGESAAFLPVDTEAIRPEDIELARSLAGKYFAIVSTDGDSDRPLIAGRDGVWLRGDVLGIVVSAFVGADAVATPVSCNTALEKSGLVKRVVRTRIGSPYVIAAMNEAVASGANMVASYEANGGFLTATDLHKFGTTLTALPTRDSFLPIVATLSRAVEAGVGVDDLVAGLPQRFTYSDRLKEFPVEKSKAILARLSLGSFEDNVKAIESHFHLFGNVVSIDTTDGVRVTFSTDEVVHLRPSGNAPEFRCYTEASSERRAVEINAAAMAIIRDIASCL